MTTRRTPINRAPRSKTTPHVVELFQRMQAARFNCTCPEPEPDAPYWQHPKPCPACDEYWASHGKLHRALGLPLNQWPAFEYPDAECPYPAAATRRTSGRSAVPSDPRRLNSIAPCSGPATNDQTTRVLFTHHSFVLNRNIQDSMNAARELLEDVGFKKACFQSSKSEYAERWCYQLGGKS